MAKSLRMPQGGMRGKPLVHPTMQAYQKQIQINPNVSITCPKRKDGKGLHENLFKVCPSLTLLRGKLGKLRLGVFAKSFGSLPSFTVYNSGS